jgi:hypothetical protein
MAQGRTVKKEPVEKITEERAKLKALEAKREQLGASLDRSLALMTLWPDVFEHGRAASQWSGRHQDPRSLVLKVFNGEDPRECREFSGVDVPEILWTAGDVRNSLTRHKVRLEKNAAMREKAADRAQLGLTKKQA